jgi:hypothetical protein
MKDGSRKNRFRGVVLCALAGILGLFLMGCEQPGGPDNPTPLKQYTIAFDSHGGSAVEAITGVEGTEVTEPAAPTKSGATFNGWFPSASGGTKYEWPHRLNADVTMHAQWQGGSVSDEYTIIYKVGAATHPNPK